MAIARTLIKKSSFLILDEPTSNLDSISANRLVYDILNCAKISVISVSHQLSYANQFSKIIVLDGGEIVECGTRDELKAHNGIYAHLLDNYEGLI